MVGSILELEILVDEFETASNARLVVVVGDHDALGDVYGGVDGKGDNIHGELEQRPEHVANVRLDERRVKPSR